MGGGRHQFVWEIKREAIKYGESILESSVLKPWNRMVFITQTES